MSKRNLVKRRYLVNNKKISAYYASTNLGEYNSEEGKDKCDPCKRGSFSNSTGLLSCFKCERGHFCDIEGLTGQKKCQDGHFAIAPRQTSCQICPIGHMCPDSFTEPSICGPGFYQDENKSVTCKSCGKGISKILPFTIKLMIKCDNFRNFRKIF